MTKSLNNQGHGTTAILAKDRGFSQETITNIKDYISGADFVLIGMSSSAELSEAEIKAAALASSRDVPYGFYGDTSNCHRRSWFAEAAKYAALYFAISEAEAEAAKNTFPNGQCIVSGNPMRATWDYLPMYNREEILDKLGLDYKTKLILVPGGKFLAGNMFRLTTVLEAVKIDSSVKVVFTQHPGDPTNRIHLNNGERYNPYSELSSFDPQLTVYRGDEKTQSLLSAVNLVIGDTGSIELEAHHRGIPTFTLRCHADRERSGLANGGQESEVDMVGIPSLNLDSHIACSIATAVEHPINNAAKGESLHGNAVSIMVAAISECI